MYSITFFFMVFDVMSINISINLMKIIKNQKYYRIVYLNKMSTDITAIGLALSNNLNLNKALA